MRASFCSTLEKPFLAGSFVSFLSLFCGYHYLSCLLHFFFTLILHFINFAFGGALDSCSLFGSCPSFFFLWDMRDRELEKGLAFFDATGSLCFAYLHNRQIVGIHSPMNHFNDEKETCYFLGLKIFGVDLLVVAGFSYQLIDSTCKGLPIYFQTVDVSRRCVTPFLDPAATCTSAHGFALSRTPEEKDPVRLPFSD